jgi:Fe-S cluster assembly protein SufD
MTTTDVKATDNLVVGGAAGEAPLIAQRTMVREEDSDGAPAPGPQLEDEAIRLAAAGVDPHATEARGTTSTRASRKASFEVADFSRPSAKDEEWRFTPLRVLKPLFADEPTDDREGDPAADYDVQIPADGGEISTLAPAQAPRGTVLVPEDLVAAVASARTEQALYLSAPKNTAPTEPYRVTVTGRGADRRANAHLVLETQESSAATFVLDHRGTARYAQNVEMTVGDNSSMTVISLQNWEDALHVATHQARVGRDAKLKHIVVSLGGRAVRVNSTGSFAAPGGEIEMLGLYFSDQDQYLEHRLFVDHSAPNCTSNSTYKGALQGQGARSVWVGDVLIRAVAEGTSTYEMNRNLVLTEGARADSVPNLEIETGEIEGAGHAAATGRFDDEQLFYLRARGIPELEARRLVVRGFFAELIQQIDVPEIREALSASIEVELERSMN